MEKTVSANLQRQSSLILLLSQYVKIPYSIIPYLLIIYCLIVLFNQVL